MVAWETESIQVALSWLRTLSIDLAGFRLISLGYKFPEANVAFYVNLDCSSTYDKELIQYFS